MDVAHSDQQYLNQSERVNRAEKRAIDIAKTISSSACSPECVLAAKQVEDSLKFKAEMLRQQTTALSMIYNHIRQCNGQKTDTSCTLVRQEMQHRKKLCAETALQISALSPDILKQCDRTQDGVSDSNILIALQALNNG
tara:strand:- start:5905 stop:6321 length:417 start_codon:yes stop_codon:yes gene_type:complete